MRWGGFPCRFEGCTDTFPVSDQSSMAALRSASAARTSHEVTEHGYHHVRRDEEQPAAR